MKILKINKVYNGFLTMLNLTLQTSNNEIIKREVMSRSGGKKSDDSVCALVLDTKSDEFIFVKQFRAGLFNEADNELIECVAGTLEVNEDPMECMSREIEEEIGYETDNIKFIGDYFVSPGGTTEKVFLYYVEVSNQISEGGGLISEHEEIEVIKIPSNTLKNFEIKDMKTKLLISEFLNK